MNNQNKKEIVKLLSIAKKGIVGKIREDIYCYNDEPRIPSFTVEIKYRSFSTYSFEMERFRRYSSFSKERCLLEALGESIERYSLSVYHKKELLWDSYENLKPRAINPTEFISFSESKIKPSFQIYNNSREKLNWVKGVSLNTHKNIFIPAQLVYLPYKLKKNEPVINFSISTGAACHSSLERAILNGVLEVIERDAFIINYLNKLSRNIIDINTSDDKTFKQIIAWLKRYNLELYLLDISTDIPVYSVLAILLDRTGLGPAISVGTKSDLSIDEAILGATEECLQVRPWIKETMVRKGIKKIREVEKNKYYLFEKVERGLLWSTPKMISKINFFLKGKRISIKNLPRKKTKNLGTLLDWFRRKKIKVIYKDVTPPNLRGGIFVVKAIVPQFQPLYLDERFPCWKGKRLKEVPKTLGLNPLKRINSFPHPFL